MRYVKRKLSYWKWRLWYWFRDRVLGKPVTVGELLEEIKITRARVVGAVKEIR